MSFHSGTLSLPAGPTAPARARRQIAHLCAALPSEAVKTAQLLTSELVTNAVTHGGDPVSMIVAYDDHVLRVDVRDSGPGVPQQARPAPMALNGRGLMIVAACAGAWGSEPLGGGKSVWFQLDA